MSRRRHAYWLPASHIAGLDLRPHVRLNTRFLRALSSAVEHYLDMVGVTGSIPVVPTRTPVRFSSATPRRFRSLKFLRRQGNSWLSILIGEASRWRIGRWRMPLLPSAVVTQCRHDDCADRIRNRHALPINRSIISPGRRVAAISFALHLFFGVAIHVGTNLTYCVGTPISGKLTD